MIAQPQRGSRVRPPGWVYALAVAPALLGVAAAVALAVTAINDAGSLIDRLFTSPTELSDRGAVTVRASRGDGRTIYEHVASSGAGLTPGAAEIRCTVRAPDGTQLGVSRASQLSLEQNGANYRSLLRFDTPLSGSYVVRCRQPGQPTLTTPLAVGPPIRITSVLTTILRLAGALFALVLGIGIAVGLGVLVHQLREKSRERVLDRSVDPLTGMPV